MWVLVLKGLKQAIEAHTARARQSTQPKLVLMSWRYVVINNCFFASIYGKWFPWEFTEGHMHSGAGEGVVVVEGGWETSMFGLLSMCRSAW